MSSAANIKNSAARVAVKVPFPDSLVEVRMSPPDSNFEVKVTPGGDVIELLIRPGCSQIEVRITQPGDQGAKRPAPSSEDQTDPDPQPESAAEAGPDSRDNEAAPTPPEAAAEEAEEEVVPGVSKTEFAAMVEEDAADEAKKLLAGMDLNSLAGAGPAPDYELPAEARKILEEDDQPEEPPLKASESQTPENEADPPPVEDAEESADPVMTAEEAAPPSEPEVPEFEASEIVDHQAGETAPAEGDEAPAESRADDSPAAPEEIAEAPLRMELEIESLPGEIIDATLTEDPEKTAAGSLEQLEIEVENISTPIGTTPAPVPIPEVEWLPKPASAGNDTDRLELDYSSSLIMEGDLGAASTATIPEAVEEAARQALARLSAAAHEEHGGLELERPSPQLPEPPAPEVASLPDQAVDRTIMVEYIEDTEAGSQQLPDDTATPLPEEDQMDLGPVEMEDEELAIDPIDLGDVEFDLEKSRTGNSADSQTVKAKPMVTALPNNTIVPQ